MPGRTLPAVHPVHLGGAEPLDEGDQPEDFADVGQG